MPRLQALNVVLTHAMADFDSLAAAVGLAKLWQDERPEDGKTVIPCTGYSLQFTPSPSTD